MVFDQLTLSIISFVEKTRDEALLVDADRVECALKVVISTPAASMTNFNHLVIELGTTGLCGAL